MRRAGHPYHHPVPLSRNLGTLTSWNTLGHSRPVMGLLYFYLYIKMRPMWLLGLRCGPSIFRLRGLRVRNPPFAWMSVSGQCYVLSGRGRCNGPITRPEDSNRVVTECILALPRGGLGQVGAKDVRRRQNQITKSRHNRIP